MKRLSRRSVLRGSASLVAAGALARPHIANAAATTATAWFAQGFVQSEDVALRKLVADYEKASGNTIDLSIVPFVALRQKQVAAIASGAVPELMEDADFSFTPLNAWATSSSMSATSSRPRNRNTARSFYSGDAFTTT